MKEFQNKLFIYFLSYSSLVLFFTFSSFVSFFLFFFLCNSDNDGCNNDGESDNSTFLRKRTNLPIFLRNFSSFLSVNN